MKIDPPNYTNLVMYSDIYGIEINMVDCTMIGVPLKMNEEDNTKLFVAYGSESSGIVGVSVIK